MADGWLAEAVSFGVVKVNVDTDNHYAVTRAVAGHVFDHWDGVLRVDGLQAQLRPASMGPRRRGSDGGAGPASMRAARIGWTQPRSFGGGE